MMLLRYFHTLRHLKAVQVFARLRNWFYRPRPDLLPPPHLRPVHGHWYSHSWRKQSMLGPTRFQFLNQERTLHFPAAWNDPATTKLWLYNLHYFDDLCALNAVSRRQWHEALIRCWIEGNPPGMGNGWEPYPISLRIVNWIRFVLAGGTLSSEALHSLAIQVRWLCCRIEYHLLGNHLLANARALIFAGAFFDGEEAHAWLNCGLAILKKELPEQILPDGGHCELSPMYHAIVLEDCLDLYNLACAFSLTGLAECLPLQKMRGWLSMMSHPDGDIGFFNDATFAIAAKPAQLEDYAAALYLPSLPLLKQAGIVQLSDSGYLRLITESAVMLIDVAAVGPDYLPGHAHADTLSFELSVFGQRLFVNSGTSCYGTSLQRQFERGTSAHNTLVLNGKNSSEVWSGFRVARRARAKLESVYNDVAVMEIIASHDGYRRLVGRNLHRRRWRLTEDVLDIQDEVTGLFSQAEVFFHLHPDVELAGLEESRLVRLCLPGIAEVELSFVACSKLRVEAGRWHPGFGLSLPSVRIVACLEGQSLTTRIQWKAIHP